MLPAKKILCPTDFSAPAEESVRTAAEMAQEFGAELLLLNVIPVLPALPPDPNYVFKVPEYEQYLHADAERQLNELANRLSAKNIRVRRLITHGPVADEIVAVAKNEGVDLVVIATHGAIDSLGLVVP